MKHAGHLIILTACIALASCREHAGTVAQTTAAPPKVEKLTLDYFTDWDIPDSLMSTSCTFSNAKDDSAGNKRRLLFVAEAGDRVFFYAAHKPVLLGLAKMENLSPEDQQKWKNGDAEFYTNGYYNLMLKTTTGKETGEESVEANGTMTLTTKDGQSIQVELKGGCGS